MDCLIFNPLWWCTEAKKALLYSHEPFLFPHSRVKLIDAYSTQIYSKQLFYTWITLRNILTLPVYSGARAPSRSLSSTKSLLPLLARSRRCVFTSELNRPTAVWEEQKRKESDEDIEKSGVQNVRNKILTIHLFPGILCDGSLLFIH